MGTHVLKGSKKEVTIFPSTKECRPPEGYVYCLIPYTEMEMRNRKDTKIAHFQMVNKKNLIDKFTTKNGVVVLNKAALAA